MTVVQTVGMVALAGLSNLAYAGVIGAVYQEPDGNCFANFTAVALHGAIGAAPLNHGFQATFMNPAKWKFEGGVTETEKAAANNDKLALDETVRHAVGTPGHGEAANDKKVPIKTSVEAGVGGIVSGPKPAEIPESARYVKHKEHFDAVAATGSVLVNPNNKDIEAYTLVIAGSHVQEQPPKPFTVALSSSISPNTYFGSAVILIDPSDEQMALALALYGLSAAVISSAVIRLGTPAMPGEEVYDLSPMLFQDIQGLGTSRQISDVFPSAHLAALESGNVFFDLVFGVDHITGQVVPITAQLIPEPAVLAMWGIGAVTFCLMRRRSLGKAQPAGTAADVQ